MRTKWALILCVVLLTFRAHAQTGAEVYPQLGPLSEITRLRYAPDGRTLVSLAGSTLLIWDVQTGRERYRVGSPARSFWTFAIAPDSKSVIVAEGSQGFRFIDLSSPGAIKRLAAPDARHVDFLGGGRALGASYSDSVATIFDLDAGRPIASLRGHTKNIWSVAFSPDGQLIATGADEGQLRLWDASGRERRAISLGGNFDAVSKLVFSPDSRFLAYGQGSTVGVMDARSGQVLHTAKGLASITGQSELAFSPDGRNLAFIAPGGTPTLLEMTNGRMQSLALRGSSASYGAAFSPDGRMLAVGQRDWSIGLLDLARNAQAGELGGKIVQLDSLAIIPKTTLFATGHLDRLIRIWDGATGRLAATLSGHKERVADVAASPDGLTLASAGEDDGTVRLWDLRTGREIATLGSHGKSAMRVAYSGDGRILASAGGDGLIKIWDPLARREVRSWKASAETIAQLKVSHDGRWLVSGPYWGEKNRLWNADTGALVREFDATGGVVLSADARTVFLVVRDEGVRVSDAQTGQQKAMLRGHEYVDHDGKRKDGVYRIALSPDGKSLVSSSHSEAVVWDIPTGRQTATFETHDLLQALAFTQDGRHIVGASFAGVIRLWSVATRKDAATMIALRDSQWITATPAGFFVSSEKGAEHMNVRIAGKVSGIDQYYERYFRPDLVQLSLAGRTLADTPNLALVKPAPEIAIVETPASTSQDEVTVTLRIVEQGGGIGDLRLYRNGSAVTIESSRNLQVAPQKATQLFRFKVRLEPGENTIRAIAFNADNSMQSADAIISILATFAPRPPALHAIVVGIKDFANPRLALNFTVADAELFAATLENQPKGLFSSITVTRLVKPEQTTREAIMAALKRAQRDVRPEDLFVFFVASHGTVDDGEYFLITSNVGSTSTARLKADSLPQDALKDLIANVPASKKLVILDTCHAGRLGDTLQVAMLTRGMSDDTAVKILSRAIGSTVLSASTPTQQALEGYNNHGLFTWVVVQGMQGRADSDRDGFVKTLELADYVDTHVPELAERVFKHRQYPIVSPTGQGFPLVKVR